MLSKPLRYDKIKIGRQITKFIPWCTNFVNLLEFSS